MPIAYFQIVHEKSLSSIKMQRGWESGRLRLSEGCLSSFDLRTPVKLQGFWLAACPRSVETNFSNGLVWFTDLLYWLEGKRFQEALPPQVCQHNWNLAWSVSWNPLYLRMAVYYSGIQIRRRSAHGALLSSETWINALWPLDSCDLPAFHRSPNSHRILCESHQPWRLMKTHLSIPWNKSRSY